VAKVICYLKDLLDSQTEIKRYVIVGLFEKITLGREISNPEEDFAIKISKPVNYIILKSNDNKMVIQLGNKNTTDDKTSFVTTHYTFVIDYSQKNFPVYNSEY